MGLTKQQFFLNIYIHYIASIVIIANSCFGRSRPTPLSLSVASWVLWSQHSYAHKCPTQKLVKCLCLKSLKMLRYAHF